MNLDTKIAAGVAGFYLLLSAILLPVTEYARALGGGILIFAIIAVAVHQIGRGPLHGMAILGVAFISAIVLAVPTFPAMGGLHAVAVPLGFLGVQAAILLLAALRWSPLPSTASHTSLAQAWMFGWLMALGLSAIATIPIVLILMTGEPRGPRILWVYPAYFIGLTAAATLYWLLQRISHLATGCYLIGFLGGICVYGAVAPVVAVFTEEPMSRTEMLVIALVAGGFVGPAFALDTTKDGLRA